MSNENQEKKEKLLQIVRDALERDQALRQEYQIGDKFRFIRDRLNSLLERVQEDLTILKKQETQAERPLQEDETLVYIYLYNAQGLVFQTWQKMVNPSVFYEYSVNRPIYAEQNQVEAYIRTKSNKNQHGFITIAVKKSDIIPQPEALIAKDMIGNVLIRVREGGFRVIHFKSFTHNNNHYILNEDGLLIKKTSADEKVQGSK